MSQVKLEHLYKRFGNVTAVGDFNLDVKDGEFISFLGPSGCGKTTTLRMIAGFERPTEGSIILGDTVVSSASEGLFMAPEKRDIGMVFQSYAVWPHMTVAENVAYPLKIQGVSKAERDRRVEEALKMVHLDQYGRRYPNQLSGGQQQRVALARALIAHPGLLLLDEPLSNLDAKLRESMRFEISTLQKELGITVIYVTHDQSEAIIKNTTVSFPNEAGIPEGDGIIAVRPENVSLSKNGGMLKGTVRHRFYMGDAVDYRIETAAGMIRVMTHGSAYHTWKDGEEIYLDFRDIILLGNERNNYIIT